MMQRGLCIWIADVYERKENSQRESYPDENHDVTASRKSLKALTNSWPSMSRTSVKMPEARSKTSTELFCHNSFSRLQPSANPYSNMALIDSSFSVGNASGDNESHERDSCSKRDVQGHDL